MGKVMLIGAGPGDAQLLTVKGLAALQRQMLLFTIASSNQRCSKNEKLVVN